MPSNLKYCTVDKVYELAPEYKGAPNQYPPLVIEGYIKRAEIKVKAVLATAYPCIMNATSWITPTKTPEMIEESTAELAVVLMRYDYALMNGQFEPSLRKMMSSVIETLYSLRGYGETTKSTVIPMDLIDRNGNVVSRTRNLPYCSTDGVDDEISMNKYSSGSIVEHGTYETEGTLNDYGSDGKL